VEAEYGAITLFGVLFQATYASSEFLKSLEKFEQFYLTATLSDSANILKQTRSKSHV